ncbi:ketosteroid isomerase-related protein [Pseudomonas typographi]|uniref:SnoaL-like domain-containing protein n=1 Tax=Pseudomonas typographi TaxID=2715964 RepID=A0ABR7Z3P1_9PSED|nr:ketosteroid isomerase-related protein [Pseudomonas typographi]MBD1551967.1 SnoaL-like domain-containing protein [Pseudomonas typographi]MBD1586531.1 SnoaL-like domain-containing protein [Pseudomonas typographi]MBD1600032.1 SnoaL-like domain-containing protein [Pseudomonas typographi]
MSTHDVIAAYYDAFNAGNMDAFMAVLSDDVVHDINQGERQHGKAAFARFMQHMNRCYRERLSDITIMANGERAAAEFIVHGQYLASDEGLPPARGQSYTLPAGAFFLVKGGQVARVTNYYNLNDWLEQVGE